MQDMNMILQEEQVILSQERTASSFMRTGLAFMGVGIVLMNAFPGDLSALVFGWMLVGVGIVLLIQYTFRLSKYGKKIRRLDDEMDNK